MAGLIAYFSIVALAAWPAPIRPSALDAAHVAANRWLQRVSIMPGHKVFAMPDQVTWMPVADCIHIRGIDAQGVARDLWPPDGRCMREGIRLRVPPLAIYLDRTLNSAASILGEPHAAIEHGHTFWAIGRTFCGRDERGEPEYESVALAWLRDLRSYQDGTQVEQPVLLFHFACAQQQFRSVAWFPQASALEAFWGGAR